MTDNPIRKFDDPVIVCPCCQGAGTLLIRDEAHPDDPPRRERCGHCSGHGNIGGKRD